LDDRPNFLVIMTEQHRGDCLGIDGHPVLMTPNMDTIGGAGVRFSHCYSTCPICMPARRSFLSGQFPATHGLVHNIGGLEWWNAPPTLPGVLRNAGYQTWWVGRSHHQFPVRKRYGFDHMVIHEMVLHEGEISDYHTWLDRVAPEGHGGYSGSGIMRDDRTARPWHLDESLHFTNWTVNEALRFLRTYRDPSCPFFLVVSFIAAHPPLTPPAFYMERYLRLELPKPTIGDWATSPPDDGRGDDVSTRRVNLKGEALRSCRAGYYGSINHVDDQIRRLINPIDGVDLITRRNTVVIFTSDHGEMLGDHYFLAKALPYEGSARVPLLVRAPERFGLKRRLVVDEPVCLEDIMPTVLDMAGVEVPDAVEGQSLLPLMRGEEVSWRPYLHVECAAPPAHHALTDGQEKYIWFTEDGREQLFDLSVDPTECHDLSVDPEAAEQLTRWRDQLVEALEGRSEGFSDGKRLIAGRPYARVLPHALPGGALGPRKEEMLQGPTTRRDS
jgi:arylsulfatase